MATYPSQRFANGTPWANLFTDPGLTRPATITDVTGKPIPQNRLVASGGSWPVFTYAGSGPLYYRLPDGNVDHLLPSATYTATAISGSRGGANAAVLANLLQALAAQGIVIDNTTA
jgi:hypothetical protein